VPNPADVKNMVI